MIIGISGKIGSGKDTVGRIIQYLDCRMKIKDKNMVFPGFREWSGMGEDGISSPTCHVKEYEKKKDSWILKKFSGKLKKVASIITGIPEENFESHKFKNSEMGKKWMVKGASLTVRKFLQILGTDIMRNILHEDIWVDALFLEYNPSMKWIITDVRFPNEYISIKERGGIMIRVRKEGKEEDIHKSETSLDYFKFDEEIFNNGDIDNLILKVEKVIKSRNIFAEDGK